MKRSLIILIILVMGLTSFSGIVITTTLTIGRKSQNCNGFGICSVAGTTTNNDGSVNGTLDFDTVRGSIILGISVNDVLNIQPDKLVYFTNKTDVLFAEDFVLPAEINTAVQSSKPLIIKKGQYSLTLRNNKYYIEIPL